MNALISQVLSKNVKNNVEINLVIKTIAKPKVTPCTSCSVTVDDPFIFYTFDGRSMFFSENETEPVISIPDETKYVEFLSSDEKDFVFLLSSKNKLECCDFEQTLSKSRYTITRNVLKMQKTKDKIYFVFKKDQGYFINECFFDSKKWVGKTLNIVPSTGNIEMFATGGNVYYIADGKVFKTSGEYLGFEADYVHQFRDAVISGILEENGYKIRILNSNDGYSVADTFSLDQNEKIHKIRAHNDILILKVEDKLLLLKIDIENKNFAISWSMKLDSDVYDFDFSIKDSEVVLYVLSNSSNPEIKKKITESNIHSQSEHLVEKNTVSSDSESFNSSEFFYEDSKELWDNKKSSILKEMESLSIVPKNIDQQSPTKQKSNLLEEVKATLNKKKLSATSSPVSEISSKVSTRDESNAQTFTDRFEIFRKNNPISTSVNLETSSKLNSDFNQSKEKPAINETKSSIAESKPDNTEAKSSIAESKPAINETKSSIAESKPNNTEAKSSIAESKPNSTEVKSSIAESKPNSTEVKSSVAETKSSVAESKPNIIESKSAFENKDKSVITESNDSLINIVNMLKTQNKEILDQIKLISHKESNYKSFIKEMMISHLVPCVEACFNEMRIHMMTEIKKILSASIFQEDSRILSIKRHLANKKSTQAICEFLKLEKHEMNSHLHLFTSSVIENADQSAIFDLLIKICELTKSSPTEIHFNLITACLMDIEVNMLTIDQIQELSVSIRNIKDMEDFDKERYPDLSCMIEIVSKKIRKRAKQGNSK